MPTAEEKVQALKAQVDTALLREYLRFHDRLSEMIEDPETFAEMREAHPREYKRIVDDLARLAALPHVKEAAAAPSLSFTPAEIEALGEALDLAHGDQEHWLKYGDPKADYGNEWPETRERKAATFRALGSAGEKLGFHGERERWNALVSEVEEA